MSNFGWKHDREGNNYLIIAEVMLQSWKVILRVGIIMEIYTDCCEVINDTTVNVIARISASTPM